MIRKAVEYFLDISFLSLNRCILCDRTFKPENQGYVCGQCLLNLNRSEINVKSIKYVKHYRVFGRYAEGWGEIIRLLKFRGVKPFAEFIGKRIRHDLGDYINFVKPDIFTFVPVHILRYWIRGLDHNKCILESTNIGFEEILVRTRWKRPLVLYDKERRREIIKGSFDLIRGVSVYNLRILIFDDVITTGSTAFTISEMLISKGAREVYWYFVAG